MTSLSREEVKMVSGLGVLAREEIPGGGEKLKEELDGEKKNEKGKKWKNWLRGF